MFGKVKVSKYECLAVEGQRRLYGFMTCERACVQNGSMQLIVSGVKEARI